MSRERSRDAIRKKCQLGAGSARRFDFVDLRSVGKPCADEHFAPLRMPGKNGGTAKLGIAIRLLGDRRRNGRNALNQEILTWLQCRWRGGLLRSGKVSERN